METFLSPEAWLTAGLVFVLRAINQSVDTVRIVMMLRGRRGLAWLLGFAESTIFVVTLLYVFQDLNNVLNIIGYSAGFATGIVLGMWLEERLAIGFSHIRIVSPNLGAAIVKRLREEGYAVTEIPARGRDGAVTLVSVSVLRRNVGKVRDAVQTVDPDAFVTAEDLRPLWRGFWRV